MGQHPVGHSRHRTAGGTAANCTQLHSAPLERRVFRTQRSINIRSLRDRSRITNHHPVAIRSRFRIRLPTLPDCLLTRLWRSCFQRKRDAAMHKYGTGSSSRPATRLTTSRDVSSGDSRIERFAYRRLDPVAAAPGSVFVDSRCRTVCLRGFGGRVFSGSEMQRCTNTEPGAVATGPSVDYEPRCSSRNSRIERFAYRRLDPVAAAPGSVFVDSRCQPSCVDIHRDTNKESERRSDRVHVRSISEASGDKETQHVLRRRAHTNDQDW